MKTTRRRGRQAGSARGAAKRRARKSAPRTASSTARSDTETKRKRVIARARAAADEQNAFGAFAISAMRSRITGHVFLRGDDIIASNARFHQMCREFRWLSGAPTPFTLIDAVRAQSKKLVEAGEVASVERYTRAGDDGVVDVRRERIGDTDSQLVAASVLDVSEVANAARAAEAARAEAKLEALREVNRQKDEFLGMLSHELRNPLAPIRNSVYILSRADADSAQGRRAREILERQVAHLARLVDDLLDVTESDRTSSRDLAGGRPL